jgi:RNA polymerase sigma-70 factor (ECF subfamily)
MMPDESFEAVMRRLKAGDGDAARDVFQRYAHRLIGLARSRLGTLMRQKVDPEDVVQSVFKSFFVRQADGRIDLDDWNGLWAMLTVITLRKCGHRVEYFRAACRDVRREADRSPSPDESGAAWEAVACEPTPSDAALLSETLEQLLQPLDERERQIAVMSLQGFTIVEIATEVKRSERTVQRVLDHVRKRLRRLRGEDAVEPPS